MPEEGECRKRINCAGGKKRKKPWDVPPSGYNKAVFTMSNPFVSLYDVESANMSVIKGDKVGDGKQMDPEVLDIAITEITRASFSASMQPSTEIGGRLVHGALTLDLFRVTKRRTQRPEVSPEQLGAGQFPVYDEQSAEELTGLCVASIENEDEEEKALVFRYESDSTESTASLELRHEGDGPGDASGDEKTRYYFKLLVQDERIVAPDKFVTVLVVECSWEAACMDKLMQAAAYVSRKDAFLNMEKGRYEPIFLHSWGQDNWRYGVFFLFGTVTVKDGAVCAVSSKITQAAFSKMLEDSTMKLRTYLDDPGAVYPNGEYVHGLLYTPLRSYKLPDMKTDGSGDLPDTDLFFQSLIRIVCGDTALSWSVDRVQERLRARQKEVEEKQGRWRKRRRTIH